MKNSTSPLAKNLLTLLLVIATTASTVHAYPGKGFSLDRPFEISYKGAQDKLLCFKIDFKNEMNQPFQLLIINEQKEVLYKKDYDNKPLNTQLLLSEIPEDCRLTFVINTNDQKLTQSFQINKEVKTVEQFVVKGL